MIGFDDFFLSLQNTPLRPAEAPLRQRLSEQFLSKKHGDTPNWESALAQLPKVIPDVVELNQNIVSIGSLDQLSPDDVHQLQLTLQHFHPWRKGPFRFFGVTIDTEWRSDWKWQRVLPHISPLKDRYILDVGCGSGYHCWRMRGAGARWVLGIDPTVRFLYQFMVAKSFLPDEPVYYLPLRSEDMPANLGAFDTVFSMGVLYHRRSPFEHLEELKGALRPGGELVLETLVVEGDERTVFVPPDRYAMMPNVWFLPSASALKIWLEKVGFVNVRIVDEGPTTLEEQRATPWMRFQSLIDFLDPADPGKTAEGHPAPRRAVLVCNKTGA